MGIGILVFLCSCCPSHRKLKRKPSSKAANCTAIVTLVLLVFGSLAYLFSGHRSLALAARSLDDLNGDIDVSLHYVTAFTTSASRLQYHLERVVYEQPFYLQPQVRVQVDPIKQTLETAKKYAGNAQKILEELAKSLPDSEKSIKSTFVALGMTLMFPLVIVVVALAPIWVAICCTRMAHNSSTSQCCECWMIRLNSPFLVLAVFLVGAAAAIELVITITTSSFCVDVDTNAITYFQHVSHANHTFWGVPDYYIKGHGKNPLDIELNYAQNEVLKAKAGVERLKGSLKGKSNWDSSKVDHEILELEDILAHCSRLLQPANVYPHFHDPLHEGICRHVIASLSWLVVVQILVGLFCLPIFSVLSAQFLRQWATFYMPGALDSSSDEDSRPFQRY